MSDLRAHAQRQRAEDQTVLFVGGAMRSGTTVIHRALCTARNSNPFISESWFLFDLFSMHSRNMKSYETRNEDQFGDRAKFDELVQLNLSYYLDMVSSRYEDPEVLILKHPDLTRYFPTVKRVMPEAKFLVIMRDPRDAIGSMKEVNARLRATHTRSRTTSFATMAEYCNFYARYYTDVFDNRSVFGNDLMVLRYEDIVTDPARCFREIGAFCGAIYDHEEVTKFNPQHAKSKILSREQRLRNPHSSAYWSEMYTQDLSTDSIGKHKAILSETETRDIETMLGGLGKMFNYW